MLANQVKLSGWLADIGVMGRQLFSAAVLGFGFGVVFGILLMVLISSFLIH